MPAPRLPASSRIWDWAGAPVTPPSGVEPDRGDWASMEPWSGAAAGARVDPCQDIRLTRNLRQKTCSALWPPSFQLVLRHRWQRPVTIGLVEPKVLWHTYTIGKG
jgi:hypothetical protein